MKVLIVGSGGREHAIAWKVAQSPKVDKIYCAPGNAGIAEYAECVNITAMEFDKLVAFAKEKEIDLTVFGMDDPLVGGVVDAVEAEGLRVFGPRKNAAILEGSKAFSKDLMIKFHNPTSAYETFSDPEAAEKYLETAKFPIVLKADGLCAGKGVLILPTLEEAKRELEEMLGSNALDFVIDNYHYDSILYNKELYCEENILLAVPKHFAVNEELGMYQLSYKNIKNKNYLNQKYPAVPLGRFADLPFIMLTQGNDTRTRGDRLCRNVGFKPNIVLEFNQQSTAYMASSTQLGATFISDILVSQLPTFENLVYYKLDGEEAKRKVFFYYKTHKYKTRVMEEFVRMMHEQI